MAGYILSKAKLLSYPHILSSLKYSTLHLESFSYTYSLLTHCHKMDMRGLSAFIADVRRLAGNETGEKNRVEQELAKIRSRFQKGTQLTEYERKKCVCKLLYISMMGYDVEFGHIEAIRLICSTQPHAKYVGYLACSLLLTEKDDMLTLLVNQLRNDLNSGKEPFECVALTAAANLPCPDFLDALSHDIARLATSINTSSGSRKKAILTFVGFHRRDPRHVDLLPVAQSLIPLPENGGYGVLNACFALFEELYTSGSSSAEHGELTAATRREIYAVLERIILKQESEPDYTYFGIPAPWLQVRALRVLAKLPPGSDVNMEGKIDALLARILQAGNKLFIENRAGKSSSRGSSNRANAMNSVVIEAIRVVIHQDSNPDLIKAVGGLLGRFLRSSHTKDANLRTLGFGLLTRFAECRTGDPFHALSSYQSAILAGLKDTDSFVLRRAMEALPAVCNVGNAPEIVGELLDVAQTSASDDLQKCAIHAILPIIDKHRADPNWYVNIVFHVVHTLGSNSQEVWEHFCRVLTREGTMRKCAVEMALESLSQIEASSSPPEALISLCAFVLGEYGKLASTPLKFTVQDQVRKLYLVYPDATPRLRSRVLSCLLKFYLMFPDPELRHSLETFFYAARGDASPEVQQRAHECAVLCRHNSLPLILQAMPPFPSKEDPNKGIQDGLPSASFPTQLLESTKPKESTYHSTSLIDDIL